MSALAVVAVLSVVPGTAAMWRAPPEALPVLAFTLVMALAIGVPLRLRHRAGTTGFTLDEAVLVAVWFSLPLAIAPVVHGGAALIAHFVQPGQRKRPLKIAFNAAQMTVSSAVATFAFGAVYAGGDVMAAASLLAVVTGTATFTLVNLSAIAELFRRLEEREYSDTFRDGWTLHVTTWIGNTSFGLLLAFVALENILATLVASTLLVGLYLGYRGYAGVLEEQERYERLHDVTQTLASATGSPDALGRFLAQLARLFGGERADLVVIVRATARYLRLEPDGTVVEPTGTEVPRILDQALHTGRAVLHSEVDAESNHRDALAAPLILEGKTVGAVAVYDRHGLEPWDETDVKLLATLAQEAAVAVKNVELVAELSEETRKLSNIVTAASDGIALVDDHGHVVTWNPAFERMTGLRAREVMGRAWSSVLEIEDDRSRERLHQVMRSVLDGRPVDLPVDLHVVRGDDRRWLRCTFAPVDPDDDGRDATGAVMIARDVTREREAEELKADFIATVSHELRTPLTPLKGFITTAESRWDDLDREQLREMFTAMHRQVGRLDALVSDLLTVAELDRSAVAFDGRQFDLSTAVEVAISELPAAAAARVEVIEDRNVRATGDARAAQRVVRALADNALKHTTGIVTVSVGQRGDEATVSVSDEGPGISEWDRERIFERFGRLGDHLTRNQGSGLGLAIARSLAERLGGRLELESEVGAGSTFVLVLPAATTDMVGSST